MVTGFSETESPRRRHRPVCCASTRTCETPIARFKAAFRSSIFHGFWSFEPAQYNNQLNHFLKNLAILGGLLYIAAAGAGGSSMDGKDSRMR